jgi:hypothetical protein
MTITEVLSCGAFPPQYAYPFLKKIRYCTPCEAITKEGICPIGAYLVPFVNRLGQVVAWIPFTTEPNTQGVVFVRLFYPADPLRVYRVNPDGSLVTVWTSPNEDY